MTTLIGGIEAGGTTFKCAVAETPNAPLQLVSIPTTTPGTTLQQVTDFFAAANHRIDRLGVACFGPIELTPGAHYGEIQKTPKLDWQQFNILAALQPITRGPVSLSTDVHAAALAEMHYGAGIGCERLVYVTVGTGIGGAYLSQHETKVPHYHPEMGHMLVPALEPDFPRGSCPFHTTCVEGFASATAIQHRWGKPADNLPPDHAAWTLCARYLAYLAVNITRLLAPDRILFGGGVINAAGLMAKIQHHFERLAGDYHLPAKPPATYLVRADTEPNAGIIGALQLATMTSGYVDGSSR